MGSLSKLFWDGVPLYTRMNEAIRIAPTYATKTPLFQLLGKSVVKVNLPASAPLHSRRGSLIALKGEIGSASSTLSVLNPLNRLPLGIPFLYQKILSTAPSECYVAAPAKCTCAILELDGLSDWTIAQRNALLAWSGGSLFLTTVFNRRGSATRWGNTRISGRGQVVLAVSGDSFRLDLSEGEDYIVHSNNILAYTQSSIPTTFRLRSKPFSFTIPALRLPTFLSNIEFFRVMRKTDTWKGIKTLFWKIRIWSRKSVWGDRQFLHFQGPASVVIQSRGTLPESLAAEEGGKGIGSNERNASMLLMEPAAEGLSSSQYLKDGLLSSHSRVSRSSVPKIATVENGTVKIDDTESFQEFLR